MQSNSALEFKDTEIGTIPSDWEIKSFKKIASKLVVGFVGSCSKHYCNSSEGVPMIRTTNLKQEGFDFSNVKYVTYDFHNKNKKSQVHTGDILVARHGENGLSCFYENSEESHALNVIILHPNEENCIPKFVFYALKSKIVLEQINATSTGTVQDVLNTKTLQKLLLPFPTKFEQKQISNILSNLDLEILILRNTNKILEKIIQTIFKSWFVDFDGQTEFVDSELGSIPKGWEIKKLGDVIELAYGKSLTAENRKFGNVPVYGSSGIVDYHDESLVNGPGIIVGRKGNVGTIFWSERPFFPIDTVFYVNTKISMYYTYYNLQRQNFINSDAAVPGLNRNQAYGLPYLLPKKEITDKFDSIALIMRGLQTTIQLQINTLSKIRDSLLPKLMSGEIRV